MINVGAIFLSNPIVSREVRWRWRGRAWTYVFAYSLLLSVMLGAYYNYIVATANEQGTSDFKAAGHDIFIFISCLQLISIMLIAPAQTATAIVNEREQGMLEAMQLTRLTPLQIILGKLLSNFFFLLTMLLVPLPIIALCFLLGGVSPGEFCLVLLLQVATAATCAIIGLFCSARSRRSGTALSLAFLLTLIWLVGSYFLIIPLALFKMGTLTTGTTAWFHWIYNCLEILFHTNPVYAIAALLSPDATRAGFTFPLGPPIPSWCISLIFQLLLSLFLLRLASGAVRRPLGEFGEVRRQRKRKIKAAKARRSTPVPVESAETPSPVLRKPLLLPVARLTFANPVLQRELRVRFQIKQPSTAIRVVGALFLFLGICTYLFLMWGLWSYPDHVGMYAWPIWATGALMLVAVIMGAMTFTREREGHTWGSLRLSLLSPRQIINGKAMAMLLTCLFYTLPVWPLMTIWYGSIIVQLYQQSRSSQISSLMDADTLSMMAALTLSSILVGVAAIWCSTACGMVFSWFHRRTSAAIGWAMMALIVSSLIAMGGPVAWERYLPLQVTTAFMQIFHPVAALSLLLHLTEGDQLVSAQTAGVEGYSELPSLLMYILSPSFSPWVHIIYVAIVSAVVIFLVGQLLLAIIHHDMQNKIDREVQQG